MTPGYLPIAAAARFVGRSPRWLRRRLASIPHYHPPSGQILVKISDLAAYLERFRIEPAQAPKIDLDAIPSSITSISRHRLTEKPHREKG
jgi:hypothetical protein